MKLSINHLFFLIFIAALSHANVDIIIESEPPPIIHRSVSITTKTHLGAGFFAKFKKVLLNLIHYEQSGIRSCSIDWTNEFFPYKTTPNENGWDLYFEPIIVDQNQMNSSEPIHQAGNAQTHDLHDQTCVAPWLRYNEYLPYRLFAHKKLNDHIKIKPHILDQVNNFYNKNLANNICIGVHVRYA